MVRAASIQRKPAGLMGQIIISKETLKAIAPHPKPAYILVIGPLTDDRLDKGGP